MEIRLNPARSMNSCIVLNEGNSLESGRGMSAPIAASTFDFRSPGFRTNMCSSPPGFSTL